MTTTETPSHLRITEIFHSLQGEARTTGLPTVFIRLTGCPLRCDYCDTEYAYQGGETRSIDEILAEVAEYGTHYICVTGGEPLAQAGCLSLLKRLCDEDYEVSLETSGALDVSQVDPRVSRIVDIKTPGSGEQAKNRFENIDCLTSKDQIKFVICDRNDYQWAKEMLIRFELGARCEVLMSASHCQLADGELANWILADQLPVRFQVQLHKVLWGNERGR